MIEEVGIAEGKARVHQSPGAYNGCYDKPNCSCGRGRLLMAKQQNGSSKAYDACDKVDYKDNYTAWVFSCCQFTCSLCVCGNNMPPNEHEQCQCTSVPCCNKL